MLTTWEDRDRPILARIAELDEEGALGGPSVYSTGDLAEDLGIEPARLDRIVERFVEHGYVTTVGGGGLVYGSIGLRGITGQGLKALGEWPSTEGDLTALIGALLEAADATEDVEQRNRLRTIATWLGEFTQDVAANVAASLAVRGVTGF